MRAVVVQPDRSVKVEYKPVPIPKPNELLYVCQSIVFPWRSC